jgi:mRNA degradation ribonuclease J1/J2
MKAKITDAVSKFLRKEARRSPAVITVIERL